MSSKIGERLEATRVVAGQAARPFYVGRQPPKVVLVRFFVASDLEIARHGASDPRGKTQPDVVTTSPYPLQ